MSEDVQDQHVQETPPEVEAQAREFGWVPQEEFKGPAEKWRTAEEFLERGKEINGFLRKDLQRLQHTHQQTAEQLAETRKALMELKEFHERSIKAARDNVLHELRVQHAEAIREGDTQLAASISEKMDAVKAEDVAPPKGDPQPTGPRQPTTEELEVFNSWAQKTGWYGTNRQLTAAADGLVGRVRAENPSLQGLEFLQKVEGAVRDLFPEKFRTRSSVVDGAGTGGGGGPTVPANKRSYENLPAAAKAQCDIFVKQKLLTREQYVKDFDWS